MRGVTSQGRGYLVEPVGHEQLPVLGHEGPEVGHEAGGDEAVAGQVVELLVQPLHRRLPALPLACGVATSASYTTCELAAGTRIERDDRLLHSYLNIK